MRSYRFALNSNTDRVDTNTGLVQVGNPDLIHQITKVLRLDTESPEEITLITGENTQVHKVVIKELLKNEIKFEIVESWQSQRELEQRVRFFVPIIKTEAFEWMLRKLTELGVQEIVPVVFERSQSQYVSKLTSDKSYERLRKIIQEATEQCEGSVFAQLKPAISSLEINVEGMKIFASERMASSEEAAESLKTLGAIQAGNVTNLNLLVGPEGGLTGTEVSHFLEHSWQPLSLGSRLLKAETAAIALFSRLGSY